MPHKPSRFARHNHCSQLDRQQQQHTLPGRPGVHSSLFSAALPSISEPRTFCSLSRHAGQIINLPHATHARTRADWFYPRLTTKHNRKANPTPTNQNRPAVSTNTTTACLSDVAARRMGDQARSSLHCSTPRHHPAEFIPRIANHRLPARARQPTPTSNTVLSEISNECR